MSGWQRHSRATTSQLQPSAPNPLARVATVTDSLSAGWKRLGQRLQMRRTDVLSSLPQLGESDVAFDQAAIGMAMVDFEGRFLRVNAALCELVGRPEATLLAMRWQDITHPDDVEAGEQGVDKTRGGKERTFRLAKRYIRSDGGLVWVLLSVSLIRSPDGVPLCFFTQAVDITEQRLAEEGVARLAAIVESSDDAILSASLDSTVLTWNRAAERMYGYTAGEMVGETLAVIVPPHLSDELAELLEAVGRGQSVTNHETVRMRKDKSPVDVSLTISPIRDARGAVIRASIIARDITEQKRMVGELASTLTALETALGEARAAEELSHRFLSDAAHHLRNPIAGIRSCVETMLRGCSAPDREQLIAEIIRETSRVSRLVDRLLRMSRLEQGEALVLERGDLLEVCRDAVERARSLAPDLLIEIVTEPLDRFRFDREAVREVLTSILDNGCRHAERRIVLTVYQCGGWACVRLSDDGPGMSRSDVERAFEPFVSLDGSGSGLGLAISRAVARAHGGDVEYEHGSFVVRLPMVGNAGSRELDEVLEYMSSSSPLL